MQPRPIADTSGPFLPSLRLLISNIIEFPFFCVAGPGHSHDMGSDVPGGEKLRLTMIVASERLVPTAFQTTISRPAVTARPITALYPSGTTPSLQVR
jgi:hypothetical protein